MDKEALPPPVCPVNGCGLSYDVILRSSDNKRFGGHSATLGSFSLGFPAPGSTTEGAEIEDVSLSESSAVLELLLKFLHPNLPQPDVTQLQMSTLEELSEAVEKYQVYPAMQVCKLVMKTTIEDHPVAVLKYALKHGYAKLGEIAMLYTLDMPLVDIYSKMKDVDPRFFGFWALYRERMNLEIRKSWINSIVNRVPIPIHDGNRCSAYNGFYGELVSFLSNRNFKPDFICFDRAIEWEKYRLAGCPLCSSWSPESAQVEWTKSVNSHRQTLFEEVFGEEESGM
ncbi:hypothetical protein PM082_015411 [Marasmius tenuissimus]|nr:hypothetical protein PM082_015411 [Marasmius tenuissimus]